MVIDVHVHPNGYPQVAQDPASRAFRDRVFQRRPQDALSAPIAMTGKPSGGNGGGNKNFDVLFTRMDHEGIDRFVLLPMDLTTRYGGWVVSNDEIEQIVAAADAIYQKCLEYNKPIMFHAGMSWEPDCLIKYSRPVNFEGVAVKYPELRICLAHFGWPWAVETAMLCLKYPNVYTDTSAIPMDSPAVFMDQILNRTWGATWFEHYFADKVMFGSNNPRHRSQRMMQGLEKIEMRPDTRAKLMGGNALKWLGMEVK